jgi:uncharacterized integral membrane protein (TIGR00698 family)
MRMNLVADTQPPAANGRMTPQGRSLSAMEKHLLGVQWRDAHRLLPGVALAAGVMVAANWLGGILGASLLRLQGLDASGKASPISGIMVAIVVGMIVANTAGLKKVFAPGLEFSLRKTLRFGIILVGLRLSFLDVVKLGVWGVPVVLTVIVAAILLTSWFAKRLRVSDRLGTLAAASTAICGVTATMAVAPAIDADDKEVAFTIANVTLFGLIAMFAYPFIAHRLFPDTPGSAGLFLGTAIHETSQVMGAALSYKEVFNDEVAMKIATIAKLTRNVFIAGVVPVLAFAYARKQRRPGKKVNVAKLFPLFVLGFLGMAVIRSVGDAGVAAGAGQAFGIWSGTAWGGFTRLIGEKFAYYALGTAMAGVGLTTSFNVFKVLGLKPLYVGAISATLVGAVSLALAALVGPFIHG